MEMMKQFVGVALLVVFMLINIATSDDLTGKDGGYEGIEVSEHKSVPEDVKIIEGIKTARTSKNRPASAAPSTLPREGFELKEFSSVDEPIPDADEEFETKSTEDFNRNLNLGNFQLTKFDNDPKIKDLPPARVSDLKVDRVSDDELRTFSLSWTAAGNVMNEGIAKKVKIAASLNGFDLLTDFKNHLLNDCDVITEMKAGGEKQTAKVKLSPILQQAIEGKINEAYDIYFALITVGKTSSKKAKVSNIAIANIGYTAPPLHITTEEPTSEKEQDGGMSPINYDLIALIALGVVLFLYVIRIIVEVWCRNGGCS